MATPKTWHEEIEILDELLRSISFETEPQSLAQLYGRGLRRLFPVENWLAFSRRGLKSPYYRITRSQRIATDINPWEEPDKLPLLKGGLLAELIYANRPAFYDEIEIPPDDPAIDFLAGTRSLYAMPTYENGECL